ncbi:MAG: peptidoglycan-binding protein, partial [Gammaproteobacteria bacterium]|nr:peptidoglycan-binding protein [Gammaproteobacteria bacterium]
AVEDGRSEEAFIAFDKVLEIDPAHREAKEKRDALFLTVADRLYKRALLAQRRQNLNQAIELWDQFLVMMPENENARLYRAKAVRMQASLQKIAAQ